MNIEDLVAELGLEGLPPEQQWHVIDELNMRVGEATLAGLNKSKIEEYEAIINGHQAVITSWLAANDPGYRDTIAYQQLAQGFESDPEKVPADKVYAAMAWVEKNNPNLSQTVAAMKADIRANLDRYRQ